MNRRSFLKNLVVGLVSAPAIVKAISETKPKPKLISYGGPRTWSFKHTQHYMGDLQWYYFKDNGIIYGPDPYPLRFNHE